MAQERCLKDIAEHGIHVLKVFGDDQWPEFAYTIGLFENFQHPELIVLGLSGDRAHDILNLARDLVRDGTSFVDGGRSTELLDGFPVAFRNVPPDHQRAQFGVADWFYGDRSYPSLQVIFPDRNGNWPWHPDASPAFRAQQPVLALADLPDWARATG